MEYRSVELLYQEWQRLVRECAGVMHAGRLKGLSATELKYEELHHALKIDAAYGRLKQAEAQQRERR